MNQCKKAGKDKEGGIHTPSPPGRTLLVFGRAPSGSSFAELSDPSPNGCCSHQSNLSWLGRWNAAVE